MSDARTIGVALGLPAPSNEQRVARRVTLAFVAFGAAWVLLTDLTLYALGVPIDVVARVETAKGWVFVAVAALLLYGVTLRSAAGLGRTQATLAAVIESIADGVLLVGRDRIVTHANPSALALLGARSRDEVAGLSTTEFARRYRVSRTDGSVMQPDEYLADRVFHEAGPLQHKVTLQPARGEARVVTSTLVAVQPLAGSPVSAAVCVLHDVTELERLERTRDRFLAVAAHSLRTPVAVLKSSAHLIKGSGASDARMLKAIERQCGRLDRLTDNLLLLARLHLGHLSVRAVELDLAELVSRVSTEMADAWPERELQAQIDSGAPVCADAEQLSLAVRDLVDEALRSSERGATVTVVCRRRGTIAEVGVRHPARVTDDPNFDEVLAYDDLGLRHHVAQAIARAHGGAVRDEPIGASHITWLSLPLAGGSDGLH